jgi:transcriptional regulator with XRE-family HTH domain
VVTHSRGVAHSPDALLKRRLDAGLRQEDLAAKDGCSQGFLSQLERGERSPSLRLLLRLGAALDCSVGDLMPRRKRTRRSA